MFDRRFVHAAIFRSLLATPFLIPALIAPAAHAQPVPNFANFASIGGLTLLGSAQQNGIQLNLTESVDNQDGAVWFNNKVAVAQGFTTEFTFSISGPSVLADGLAFVIQNVGLAAIGTSGEGIGYAGITNSLAVELDTFQNADLGDPATTHISVQSCGTAANSASHLGSCELGINAALPSVITDGNAHNLTFQYIPPASPSPGQIVVSLDGTQIISATKDGAGNPLDLNALLGLTDGTAFVGFTGATGTFVETGSLRSWTLVTGTGPLPTPGPTAAPTPTAVAAASSVLGQPNFSQRAPNQPGAQGYDGAAAVAIDRSSATNRLYVADSVNNRVLGYLNAATFASGAAADLVIGQADFFSTGCNGTGGPSAISLCDPLGVAVDSKGNLYVGDAGNNRVTVYANPFAALAASGQNSGFAATMVLGQGGDFSSSSCNLGGPSPSAGTLCSPYQLALDSADNLYVADQRNNRVLEFNTPLASGNAFAATVFGQSGSFTSNVAAAGANGLAAPEGVALDAANNLYIADASNDRILEFNTPLTKTAVAGSGDTTADLVFGQNGSFATTACNIGEGPSAAGLCGPGGLTVDSAGDLFAADRGNSRVLEYLTPLQQVAGVPGSGDTIADNVFGQANDFTAGECNLGAVFPAAGTLCAASGVALDAAGDVFVADPSNNRVLSYPAQSTTATRVLGHSSFTVASANQVTAQSLSGPEPIALDRSATPNHLYVADTQNSRVLGYMNAQSFAIGAPADLVIGQPNFFSNACDAGGRVTAANLCFPEGVAVDGSGNLYVADTRNNRVLAFANPFSLLAATGQKSGEAANAVFGQVGSFSASSCNLNGSIPTAKTMCQPAGMGFDGAGNLYVADRSNNRILEFNTPASNTIANAVFGQGAAGNSFNTANAGTGPTALDAPQSVAFDLAGNLYVADSDNSRVIEFNEAASPPTNFTANTAFGQFGSLTSNSCDAGVGTASPDGLCVPEGVALDAAGDVFVADTSNSRVVEYLTPFVSNGPGTGDTTADAVFGQGNNLRASRCNFGGSSAVAGSLCSPGGVVLDSSNDLFIGDTDNNRVLRVIPESGTNLTLERRAAITTLAYAPAAVEFGKLRIGARNARRKVVIRNLGMAPVGITGLHVIGDGDFGLSSTCEGELPPGGKCAVIVSFKPMTAGRRGGSLVFSDASSGVPRVIRLWGHGMPAARSKRRW